MYEKILVPVDFGDLTPVVLDHAIELARLAKSRCHLVHAIEPIDTAADAETQGFYLSLESRASGLLDDLKKRCDEAGVACESTIRIGHRSRVILECAASWEADLIVVGSRPMLRDGKPHLGSTSHQVFFAASCPVLVVRLDEAS